jgi:hypothetical protein
MSRGITKPKLRNSYPQVAEVLDKIEQAHKKRHYWFFANYDGKYNTPAGGKRTVSFGAIIDVLNENGFDVEINVKPNPNKRQLWETLINP